MRFFIIALSALPALTLLAATCVVSVEQRSSLDRGLGPWVGEVQNFGDTPAAESFVRLEAVDATGYRYEVRQPTCPQHLDPGERATYTTSVVAPPGLRCAIALRRRVERGAAQRYADHMQPHALAPAA